jgi:hypothetical protein
MALVAELEKIRQEVEAINTQVAALCEGLSEEDLAWRVEPRQWSIAEVLAHLQLTNHALLPSVDQAIEHARRRNLYSNGPFRLNMIGRLSLWLIEPPPRIKFPAPKSLRPLLKGPARDALPQFLESQQLVMQRVEASSGLDLARARVVPPVYSFVRTNLLALFTLFTCHERCHLWQAANVRQHLSPRLETLEVIS